MSVVVVVVASAAVYSYYKLQGNINGVDITKALGNDRPAQPAVATGPQRPLNVLVLGSDSRKGSNIGGQTPGCPTPRCCCTSRPTGAARTA